MGDNTKNHFNKKGFSGHKFFNEMWGKGYFFPNTIFLEESINLFFTNLRLIMYSWLQYLLQILKIEQLLGATQIPPHLPLNYFSNTPPTLLSTMPNGLGIKSIFALIIQHNYDKSFINCPTNVVLILIPGPPGAPHRLRTNKLNVIYKLNHLTES